MLGETYLTKLTKEPKPLGTTLGLDQARLFKKFVYGSLDVLRNLVVPHQTEKPGEPAKGYDHSMEPIWNMLRQDTANNIAPTNPKSSKSTLPTNNIQPFGNNSKQPAIAQQAKQNIQTQLADQRRQQQDQAQKTLRQGLIEQQSSFGSG